MYYDDYGNSIFLNFKINENNINYSKNLNYISKKTKWIPKTIYAKNFLIKNLTGKKKKSRYLAVLGHLHHGKSTFINNLSSSVHLVNQKSLFKDFTDFFFLEKQRALSLQTSITTLLVCNKKGKSIILTLVDCPGHPEFFDQSLTGIKISDGSLIIIDIYEGILIGTELALRNTITEGLPIIIILNAIDRLILENGYSAKIIHKSIIKILDEINSILEECAFKNNSKLAHTLKFFNPIENNVCFASYLQGWSFTLQQYAEIYISSQPSISLSLSDLCLKFWNNFYYEKKNDSLKILKNKKKTMFVDFILEPLYKLIFLTIGEPVLHIQKFLEIELGLFGIKNYELTINRLELIQSCFVFFFGGCRRSKLIPNHTGLISSVINNIPCFDKSKQYKRNFLNKFNSLTCLGYIYKLCPVRNDNKFYGLTRIIKGRIQFKTKVSIVTEGHIYYSSEYIRLICEIQEIYLPIGRYNLNISAASNGSIIFIRGVDNVVKKSAIFFRNNNCIKNIEYFYFSFIKKILENGLYSSFSISIEPMYSYQLKKLYNSLRKCNKIYSSLISEVDQFGKLLIHGTGELYLDCVIHDCRFVFEQIDLKISKPFSKKKESIESDLSLFETGVDDKLKFSVSKTCILYNQINSCVKNEMFPDLKNNLSSNYWKKLKKSINSGFIINNIEEKYQLDKSKVNSFWCLGPEAISPPSCCLVGNSIVKKISRLNKKQLNQGFRLAIEQGPIIFESLHQIIFDMKIRKKNLILKNKNEHFAGNIRRVFHALFIQNKPSIFEPYYFSEVSFQSKFFSVIKNTIQSRNGNILSTHFFIERKEFIIKFNVPLSHSIGINLEFIYLTNKNTKCNLIFDNWKK